MTFRRFSFLWAGVVYHCCFSTLPVHPYRKIKNRLVANSASSDRGWVLLSRVCMTWSTTTLRWICMHCKQCTSIEVPLFEGGSLLCRCSWCCWLIYWKPLFKGMFFKIINLHMCKMIIFHICFKNKIIELNWAQRTQTFTMCTKHIIILILCLHCLSPIK